MKIEFTQEALADRRRFELNDAQWEAFLEALDRPVQSKPRLRKLMVDQGLLD